MCFQPCDVVVCYLHAMHAKPTVPCRPTHPHLTGVFDYCRLLTQESVLIKHNTTLEECRQHCLSTPNCTGYMTLEDGDGQLLVTQLLVDDTQASCTPLIASYQGRKLTTHTSTCRDCFHRCHTTDKCSGLIFNNTLLYRDEMHACDALEPWQQGADDGVVA